MKVFIVVNDYSNMEEHCGEYRDCFLNEIEAYQFVGIVDVSAILCIVQPTTNQTHIANQM